MECAKNYENSRIIIWDIQKTSGLFFLSGHGVIILEEFESSINNKNLQKLDSLHWYSQRRNCKQVLYRHCVSCDVSPACMALFTFCTMRRDSAKCHICGGCASWRGTMIPKFELGRDYCTMHLPPAKFHHPILHNLKSLARCNLQWS